MSCFFNNFVDILVHISVSENDFRNKLKKNVFKKQIININYRRTATKKSDWKEVDDILQSDSESKSRPLRKKDSTSTIGSYGKPTSSQSGKGYNPREDPHINGHDR